MKVDSVLSGINRLFLDTAPVIYYVEQHPQYFVLMQPIFRSLSRGDFVAVTSPVTLAETLMFPLRDSNPQQQQVFTEVITTAAFTTFVAIDAGIAVKAAQLRVQYSLKLPDALQLATAIVSGCDVFLTNDFQLKKVAELQVLVVDELEV